MNHLSTLFVLGPVGSGKSYQRINQQSTEAVTATKFVGNTFSYGKLNLPRHTVTMKLTRDPNSNNYGQNFESYSSDQNNYSQYTTGKTQSKGQQQTEKYRATDQIGLDSYPYVFDGYDTYQQGQSNFQDRPWYSNKQYEVKNYSKQIVNPYKEKAKVEFIIDDLSEDDNSNIENYSIKKMIESILENYQQMTSEFICNKPPSQEQKIHYKVQTYLSGNQNSEDYTQEQDYDQKCYFKVYDNIIEAFSKRVNDQQLILNDERVERALLLLDIMYFVPHFSESKIEKHIVRFLTNQSIDSGELFDSTTKMIFNDMSPKQKNSLQGQQNLFYKLQDLKDSGRQTDLKLEFLYHIDQKLVKKDMSQERKRNLTYFKSILSLGENRLDIYGRQISLSTFKNKNEELSIDDFIHRYELSVTQQKQLLNICNYKKKVQEFKIGYLVDMLGLSETQIEQIYSSHPFSSLYQGYQSFNGIAPSQIFSHDENYKFHDEHVFKYEIPQNELVLINFKPMVKEFRHQLNLSIYQSNILYNRFLKGEDICYAKYGDLIYEVGLNQYQIKRLISYMSYLQGSSEFHLHLRMYKSKMQGADKNRQVYDQLFFDGEVLMASQIIRGGSYDKLRHQKCLMEEFRHIMAQEEKRKLVQYNENGIQ